VTLAIEKTDTSAMAWGAGVIGEERKPRQPKTVLFSANFTGDKPIWFELTYDSEIIAEEAEEQWRKRTAVFGEAMSLKRLGSTITVENAGGASLADLLMLSIREELRDTKQAAACMRNLREIAMGSIVYASENDGESPASLEVMRDKGLVSSDGLRCPCPESQQRGGYFYWPPSPTAPGLTFVACELDSNHGRFRHVAMKNAAVLKMTEEAFQAKLKLPQNAAFAEALKKAEK
jgi:hypothetical protein